MTHLGTAAVSEKGLSFPAADKTATIYRIRSGDSVYIGETTNLYRRFGGFRRPGGSDKTVVPRTNRRVQRWLLTEIQSGNTPSIEICTEAFVRVATESKLDLEQKAHRLLVENLLIHEEQLAGRELINL